MHITVNDQDLELQDGSTVVDLLTQLGLSGTRVAIEINKTLVRRADHAATLLKAGDHIEVVTLVGGG